MVVYNAQCRAVPCVDKLWQGCSCQLIHKMVALCLSVCLRHVVVAVVAVEQLTSSREINKAFDV